MMIFTYVIFDKSESVFDTIPLVKDSEIEKLNFEDLSNFLLNLDVQKPKKYNENIKYLKLPNDIEIILVNATTNKKLKQNAIGIIVGSGAMNDDKIDGLAHLTEHMLFLVK